MDLDVAELTIQFSLFRVLTEPSWDRLRMSDEGRFIAATTYCGSGMREHVRSKHFVRDIKRCQDRVFLVHLGSTLSVNIEPRREEMHRGRTVACLHQTTWYRWIAAKLRAYSTLVECPTGIQQ